MADHGDFVEGGPPHGRRDNRPREGHRMERIHGQDPYPPSQREKDYREGLIRRKVFLLSIGERGFGQEKGDKELS